MALAAGAEGTSDLGAQVRTLEEAVAAAGGDVERIDVLLSALTGAVRGASDRVEAVAGEVLAFPPEVLGTELRLFADRLDIEVLLALARHPRSPAVPAGYVFRLPDEDDLGAADYLEALGVAVVEQSRRRRAGRRQRLGEVSRVLQDFTEHRGVDRHPLAGRPRHGAFGMQALE